MVPTGVSGRSVWRARSGSALGRWLSGPRRLVQAPSPASLLLPVVVVVGAWCGSDGGVERLVLVAAGAAVTECECT